MSVPVAPGRRPVLGHAPALLRRGFGFTEGLHAHGDVVRVYIGTLPMYFVTTPELTHRVLVIDSVSFGKGAVFDKFRPFVGNGLVNSGGAYRLGCVPRGAGNRMCVGNAFRHDRDGRDGGDDREPPAARTVPDRPLRVKYTSTACPARLSMTAVPR